MGKTALFLTARAERSPEKVSGRKRVAIEIYFPYIGAIRIR